MDKACMNEAEMSMSAAQRGRVASSLMEVALVAELSYAPVYIGVQMS